MFPNECPSALLGQLTNPRGFKATLGDGLRLWLPTVDKMGGICEASADTTVFVPLVDLDSSVLPLLVKKGCALGRSDETT